MSMEHKAFGFKWSEFEETLLPALRSHLEGDGRPIEEFVHAKADSLCDPYEGTPLSMADVEAALARGEHDYAAEAALTAFYSPIADVGVGYRYLDIHSRLEAVDPEFAGVLHGATLSHRGVVFDPGRMGTFFCNLDEVESKSLLVSQITDAEMKAALTPMIEAGLSVGGLYITF